ncbi:tRNA dihydrouridine synthase DusB [soil metagenome]
MELRLGAFVPAAPVVLAPMAGVTDVSFRSVCRGFGPGLVYVNEMVMSSAVVHGNSKTRRMMTFGADEHPRSLQLYGSDPVVVRQAVSLIGDGDRADHIDLNFGCPAAKVTRKGGGAAVPAHPGLLRAIVRAAVAAAAPFGIPVTAKFRMGLTDDVLTHLRTGEICAEEGVAAIALHARTAEQHYAGEARWDAIAELTDRVTGVPVLGNGDIWEADDAMAMLRATGCHGVVIGRGCLGRPWLFEDLLGLFRGQPARSAPALGEVVFVMAGHAALLAAHNGESIAMRQFRKHASWYLAGYPVGSEARRRFGMVSSLGELDDLLGALDPDAVLVAGGARVKRGHANGPIKVALPDGYLDRPDDLTVPGDGHVMAMSGG